MKGGKHLNEARAKNYSLQSLLIDRATSRKGPGEGYYLESGISLHLPIFFFDKSGYREPDMLFYIGGHTSLF